MLTPGLSGSSVLTSLIARAGYWTGDSTFAKKDYDTYENNELVSLNQQLIDASGYRGNYQMEFSPEAISLVSRVSATVDEAPFRSFLDRCNQQGRWVWKDPRLWLTIRYWKRLLDLENCRFIALTRETVQLWISATLRRQIQTYKYVRDYNDGIMDSIMAFLREHDLPHLRIVYDDLIVKPERTIDELNQLLATNLTVEDLRAVYRHDLYKRPRSKTDLAKATMIYLKNYNQRYR